MKPGNQEILFDMDEIKTLDPAIRRVIAGMFYEFGNICMTLSDICARLDALEKAANLDSP